MWTHKNVIAGALLIVESLMYPAAPDTMHPTTNPTIILMFFMKGEPKISVRMIVANERNPRPMNSGEPHLHLVERTACKESRHYYSRKWSWCENRRA